MRRRISVIAAGTAAGLALAGCEGTPGPVSSPGPTASATASASPTPSHSGRDIAILHRAARKLAKASFRFAGGSGVSRVDGAFDPKREVGDIHGSFGIGAAKVVVFGHDVYANGVADDPAVWLHIDGNRLAPGSGLTEATDPMAVAGYLTVVDSADSPSPRQYVGTIDVARLRKRAANSDKAAVTLLALLGAEPDQARFEASLDRSGRLAKVTITVPATEARASNTMSTRYHDFGTSVRPKRPDAQTVREAPGQLYRVLAPPATPSPTPSGTSSPKSSSDR